MHQGFRHMTGPAKYRRPKENQEFIDRPGALLTAVDQFNLDGNRESAPHKVNSSQQWLLAIPDRLANITA